MEPLHRDVSVEGRKNKRLRKCRQTMSRYHSCSGYYELSREEISLRPRRAIFYCTLTSPRKLIVTPYWKGLRLATSEAVGYAGRKISIIQAAVYWECHPNTSRRSHPRSARIVS